MTSVRRFHRGSSLTFFRGFTGWICRLLPLLLLLLLIAVLMPVVVAAVAATM